MSVFSTILKLLNSNSFLYVSFFGNEEEKKKFKPKFTYNPQDNTL